MGKSEQAWQEIEKGVSIYRRPGRASWYLNLEMGGVRKRYSLGTTDVKKARLIAREKADDRLVQRHGVQVGDIRIIRVVAKFIRSRWQKNRRKSTIQILLGIFRDFLAFCSERRLDTLSQLRPEHLEDFVAYRRVSRELANVTSNRDRSWLKAFVRWCIKRRYLRVNIADTLEMLTVDVKVKYTPPLTDVKALIDNCTQVIADLIVFLVNTGCRISEGINLTKEQIDLKTGIAILRRSKNHAEMEYRLNSPALKVVKRRILAAGLSGLIFPSLVDTTLSRHNVARSFRDACDAAKVRRFGPHALRRCWLTHIRPLVGDAVAMDLGGWSSGVVMAKYYDSGKGKMKSPTVLNLVS